jgi:amino acid permease
MGALSARVDTLSPFWLTFGLTIAFSFSRPCWRCRSGAAGTGPGVVLVAVIGMMNVLTMACMAEACARSGDVRYGRAFLGRLVAGYLGPEAASFFTATTAFRTFLALIASSVGIGLTLAAFTGLRAEIWMVTLLVLEVAYLSRTSSRVTVATMLSLVSVNLACLVVIAVLAFRWLDLGKLAHSDVSFLAATPSDPGLLRVAFGW